MENWRTQHLLLYNIWYNAHPVRRDYKNPDLQKLWFHCQNRRPTENNSTIQAPLFNQLSTKIQFFFLISFAFFLYWMIETCIYNLPGKCFCSKRAWQMTGRWEIEWIFGFCQCSARGKKKRLERMEKAKMWGRSVIYCGQCTIRFPNLSNGLWISWRVIFMWSLFIFRERSVGIIMC